MNRKKWDTLKKCANMEAIDKIPVGLIVDSPWIPGYVNMSTIDYFSIPEKWFEAQLQIKRDFPEVILIPDFWVEFGMAAEPSGFGCKTSFFDYKTPNVSTLIDSAEDIGRICDSTVPNPRTDGFMPILLNQYRYADKKAADMGESIKIVAARGPLATATHLMGLTEFLVALKVYPEETHRLLKLTTALAVNWLQAQAEALSEVEGILLLDDIVGFLSKDDYLEFAHPYLKKIMGAFPETIRIFHNDTDNTVCYGYLEELGANIFNFTYKQDIARVRQLCGDKVCLMGNIPPLEVLTNGTPAMVKDRVSECIKSLGDTRGIILSAGGGVSPGTPRENVRALIEAVK